MESAGDSKLSQHAAHQKIDIQCSTAVSACCGAMDAAEAIGVADELNAALDALLHVLATSSLLANRPVPVVRH